MKKVILLLSIITCASYSFGQQNTVSNAKPLGFLNPAIQNTKIDKGIVSLSAVVNSFVEEPMPLGYLAVGEFKLGKNSRIGISSLSFENRLYGQSSTKLYASHRLALEDGRYLTIGGEVGRYSHSVKPQEFNKVYAPNRFYFDSDSSLDASVEGIDLGLGIAFTGNGLTFGLSFSKLNRPAAYAFPTAMYSSIPDSSFVYKDTTAILEKGNFTFQNNINIMYEWQASKSVTIIHSLHLSNLRLNGIEYTGFQNIAEINKKHSVGLGAFFNGSTGFMASGGFGLSENLKIEAALFMSEDFTFNVPLDIYESNGYRPSLEANIRFSF